MGWRLLGTDPDDIAFNVYRSTGGAAPVKLNPEPLRNATNFVDSGRELEGSPRLLRPAGATAAGKARPSAPFRLPADAPARPYLSIPLQTLPGHTPNDASVGDLDGDGEYEIILKQEMRGRDNSQAGHDGGNEARSVQARRPLPLADQPRQEHPGGRPLHPVHGLRPRRRRQGRGRLQDGRRHDRRHGHADRRRRTPITATPRASSSTGRSSSPSSKARPARRWPRPVTSRPGEGRPTGATTAATGSTASSRPSRTSTGRGRA